MPQLSVLMPARNAERTIGPAVRSTLRAMPRDSELFVHDDASDDQTLGVLGGIADKRLRVITSPHPRGVAGGLNYLLDEVDAELVARMDADDICLPWRFPVQLRAASQIDMVFSTVVYLGPGRFRPAFKAPVPISCEAFPLHLLLANPVAHDTMLGRAEDLRAVGGYRDVPAEDYDLWMRLAVQGVTMVRLAPPTLIVRMHRGSLTASQDWRTNASRDQQIVDSYTALAGRYLEHPVDWYEPLRAARRGRLIGRGQRQHLAAFVVALSTAASHLSPREGRFLRMKSQAILARAVEGDAVPPVSEAL